MRPQLSTLLALSLLMVLSCSRRTAQVSDPAAFEAYLSAYTSSIVSRTSPVVVRFNAPYGQDREAEKETARLLQLEPSVKGTLFWTDPYTLQFTPEASLREGTEYLATLELGRLVDGLPDSLRQFRFRFRTRDQHLRLAVGELSIPDESRPDAFELEGVLYTSDHADETLLETCLTLEAGGQKPEIHWTHEQNGTLHRFRIYPLQAGKADLNLTLKWNGQPIGLKQDGSESVIIPSTSKFQVLKWTSGQGANSEVRLSFSQLLDKKQDLNGLIYLASAPDLQPRFLIEGNRVTCYFPQRLEGTHTLMVRQSLRNHAGKTLDQALNALLDFTQAAPALRLVGDGTILPHAGELYFPFEAVNLQAVDVEIFRVHKTNMLQFLQVNALDGDYEMHRVGRIVWSGKVDLSALNPERNQHEFVRYALDLARLIEPDPQALYQVRIGFWKEYSSYACDQPVPQATEEEAEPESEDWFQPFDPEETESNLMHQYYGRKGWTRNYRWENRENPCLEEYYNSERFISRNILASNLGLTAKRAQSGEVLLVCTDLRSAGPVGGAEVTFYDYQMQILLKGKTNAEGIFLGTMPRKADFAVVTKGLESGYLVLREYAALSTSDFPTEGTAVQKGLRGWAYAERGVWRPGDSIFLNLILFDPGKTLPANYPVTMELSDPRGRQVVRQVNGNPAGPVYGFPVATLPDAPTGVWHARFLAGGAVFHHYLRVETIKPNRYQLRLDLGRERLSRASEPQSGTLTARWLHGAAAPNQEAVIEVRAVSIPTTFPELKNYRFDHPERERVDQTFVWIKDRTDEQGVLPIRQKNLLNPTQAPGRLRADMKMRVSEPGGGFSQDFASLIYDPYSYYAGVQIPLNSQGEPRFDPDQSVTLRFASVGADGKPGPNRRLQVKVIRKEWRWWWERYRDNRTFSNHAESAEEVQSTILTTDSRGLAEWKLRFDRNDRYLVEVCDTQSGHCSGEDIYIWNSQDPGMARELRYFQFKTDKESGRPGEDIHLELPAGKGGQALVSIETGSRIISARLVPLAETPTRHPIRVTRDMGPNFYIHVSLLQAHSRENDLPLRLYGIQSVTVEDPATRLEPEVKAPAEMRPDQTYTITVREKQKKGMAYTLALVDEGLLDLTRFRTPDPHKNLFSKEALGVKTWDLFDQVLGGYAGDLKRIVSIGGDGAAPKPDGNPKATRFKPALVHLGPFYLAPGKTASHEVRIPNYVGSVRLMLVAAGEMAFGHTEQTIPVRKPLMTAATLPRQLGLGEDLELAVTVFAMDNKVREAQIKVSEKNNLVRFRGTTTQTARFSKPGETTLYFPLSTGDRSGIARFEIEASGGGESTRHTIELDIRNPNPLQTNTVEVLLKPGQSHVFQESLIGTPGSNEVVLHAMTLPPVQLESRLNQLIHYPYGCLEQTTSAVFPLLFLPGVMDLPAARVQEMQQRINQGIRRILSMKDGQGRLLYWPEGLYHHPWSEVYATLFLALARENGYAVPDAAWRSILEYQKRLANAWDGSEKTLEAYGLSTRTLQAFRLYALAQAGEAPLGALNRLRERKERSEMDSWLLAAAYARSGKADIARSLTAGLSRTVPAYRDSRFSFGSDLRDLALICLALQETGDRDSAFKVLRVLAGQMNSGGWYSTHSLAMGLWAYTRYAKQHGASGKPSLIYALEKGERKQLVSDRPLLRQSLSPQDIQGKPLKVENSGSGELHVQLALSGRPPAGQESAGENGIELRIRYIGLDGKPLDIRRLTVGTDFLAVAELRHQSAGDAPISEVVLHQAIPSGWEIRNTRMESEAVLALPPMKYKYQDIRDDRSATFFDLAKTRNSQGQVVPQIYYLALTAAYPGRYYLPSWQAEAMYDADLRASLPGQWVEVTEAGNR
jgi:alpha-2-macroglobulin